MNSKYQTLKKYTPLFVPHLLIDVQKEKTLR